MKDIVIVRGEESFDQDFPEIEVGARSTPGGRGQDSKDWWGARRALGALYSDKIVVGPARLRKVPETTICATPDFELCSSLGFAFLEITEATHPADQQEMTRSETLEGGHLLGALGGRGHRGFAGDTPYRMIAEDIRAAILRKRDRYLNNVRQAMLLGIYVNSNPGLFLTNFQRLDGFLQTSDIDSAGFRGIVLFKDRDETHRCFFT